MTLKKTFYSLVVLILSVAIFPVTDVFASELNNDKVITVGYNVRADIVENIDNMGNEGYGYEILKKIEEISDLRFEFVEIDGDVFEAIQRGEVDIAGLYYDTPERREDFLYMQTPLSAVSAGLMVSMENEFPFASPADINGKSVATYDGNLANEYMDEFLEENNISVEYKIGELHNYLEQNADLYLMYSSNTTIAGYTTVLNLAKRNAFIISRYGNEKMMDEINEAINYIILNEGDYFEELAQKYYPGHFSAFHRNLTVDELDVLRQRPLTVAYETNHSPFSSQNAQEEPTGAIVDVMNMLVEKYDFEVIYQPYTFSDPSTYPEHSDIIISAIGTVDYYNTYYTPTEAYYSIQMISMVPKNMALRYNTTEEIRVASEKIGVMNYLNSNFSIFMDYAVESEFVFYPSFQELLQAYEQEEIDMAVFTQSGTTYANSYLEGNDHYTYATDFFLDFHFGIENSIAEKYVPLFNVMLDNISSTEYEKILVANTSTYFYEDTFWDMLVENIHFIVIIIVLIAMAFLLFAYNKQKEKQKGIEVAYNTDAMTGLITFQKFRAEVDKTLENAKPGQYEIITFDIDMFKTINTHFSIERGNIIIVAIADELKKVFEGTDALISRRIADQFLVFRSINEGGDISQIYKTSILPAIEHNINQKYKVALSFGNIIIENVKEKSTALIGQADSARSMGKSKHRTTFITFDDKMRKLYEDKINITFRMEQALKDHEFIVEYQPKVDFKTLKIGGAEALVRWTPKIGEKIYPDTFIPVFEENGFISYLDLYVLEEACKCIKANCYKMDIPRISVNLSSHTVLADKIINRISEILDIYDIGKEMIELEITESAVEANTQQFLSTIKQFKKLGFAISIDDFGAGVSSLNRLSSIEADILKLDKAFFNLKEQGGKSMVVVTDVINMAKHLNMKVVAEGVETVAQALWLQSIGCDYAQGYYFDKPMKVEDFKALLTEKKQYSIGLD